MKNWCMGINQKFYDNLIPEDIPIVASMEKGDTWEVDKYEKIGFWYRPTWTTKWGTHAIGDRLNRSHFPENFYRNYGKKLIDILEDEMFDHNPYLIRGEKPEVVYDTLLPYPLKGRLKQYPLNDFLPAEMYRDLPVGTVSSMADVCNYFFDSNMKTYLRHPRLYKYEDIETKQNKVVINTQGNVVCTGFNSNTFEVILENYKNYEIVQIGGEHDCYIEHEKIERKLNLPFWESAKEIAEAAIYIGVLTGPYEIAKCYPKVRKKIILFQHPLYTDYDITQYNGERWDINDLERFHPGHRNFLEFQWCDHNTEYYNEHDYDIGVTMSYKKI
tara:strand:- start:435 stop:1421 length:987 start_codon:yes stop_codon:yes gene_type:complete